MKTCAHCGAPNPDQRPDCYACGKTLQAVPDQTQQFAVPQPPPPPAAVAVPMPSTPRFCDLRGAILLCQIVGYLCLITGTLLGLVTAWLFITANQQIGAILGCASFVVCTVGGLAMFALLRGASEHLSATMYLAADIRRIADWAERVPMSQPGPGIIP